MNIEKKCGIKNEMTDIEKEFWEDQIGNDYLIGAQVGRSGARSSAYLVTDKHNNKYILKISNEYNDEKWIDSQKNAIQMRDKLFEGHKGDISIPNEIYIGEHCILETYGGTEFSSEIYQKLTHEEKNKVAYDMASFLNFIHQKEIVLDNEKYKKELNPSLEKIIEYFSSFLNEEWKSYFEDKIELFNELDLEQEIIVNTHSDIRYQNILYDEDTRKITIIDFECARKNSIYGDLVPAAAASFGLSYDFLQNVISEYNQLEKKIPLYIDPSKVKLLHEIGVLHEYGRVAIYNNKNDISIENIVNNVLIPKIKEIDQSFLNEIKTK